MEKEETTDNNYCNEERLEVDDDLNSTEKKFYECSSCNFNFTNIKEHLKKYHNSPNGDVIEVIQEEDDEEKQCKSDDEGVAFVVNNDGKYHCNECSKTFKILKRFVVHMKLHDSDNASKTDLKSNLIDANEEALFCCTFCNAQFSTRKRLLLHSSIHRNVATAKIRGEQTPQSQNTMNCKICNKSLLNEVEYKLHLQAHEGINKRDENVNVKISKNNTKKGVHNCQFCNKEFKRPHEKVKHERIHTNEKPYSCDICGKKFRVTYCLNLHKRNVHSEDRPYICTFDGCGKRFKAQSVYNHHINTHSTEKKFRCPYCEKCFKTSVQLIGHKKTHTKPFSCQICMRPFSSLYAVKTHMATHKNENSNLNLTCKICGAQYGRAFALKDHLKEAHPDADKIESVQIEESYIIETEIDMNDDSELYSVVL